MGGAFWLGLFTYQCSENPTTIACSATTTPFRRSRLSSLPASSSLRSVRASRPPKQPARPRPSSSNNHGRVLSQFINPLGPKAQTLGPFLIHAQSAANGPRTIFKSDQLLPVTAPPIPQGREQVPSRRTPQDARSPRRTKCAAWASCMSEDAPGGNLLSARIGKTNYATV